MLAAESCFGSPGLGGQGFVCQGRQDLLGKARFYGSTKQLALPGKAGGKVVPGNQTCPKYYFSYGLLVHIFIRSNYSDFFSCLLSFLSSAWDLRFYTIIYLFQVEMILQALEYEKGIDLLSQLTMRQSSFCLMCMQFCTFNQG